MRDGAEAVRLAEQADKTTGGANPGVLDTLAAAYAEAGRFEEAQATARRAVELARAGEATALASQIEARLSLYAQGVAYREQ